MEWYTNHIQYTYFGHCDKDGLWLVSQECLTANLSLKNVSLVLFYINNYSQGRFVIKDKSFALLELIASSITAE